MKIKFLTLCLFISTISFAQIDQIIGKWQFQDIEGREKIDSVGLVLMEKMFSTMTYHIKEDSTYERIFLGAKDPGKWDLSEDEKFINFYSDKGENNSEEIIDYSENTLILKGMKMTVIFSRIEPTEEDNVVQEKQEPLVRVSATKEQICKLWYAKEKKNPEYSDKEQKLANILVKSFMYRFDMDGTFYSKAMSVENETSWEFGDNNESFIIKGESFDVVWNINSISEDELVLSKGNSKDIWIFSTEPNE